MPLFHSNAIFVGMMPAFWVGGALGINERFSASKFTPDVFRYGVTFWNYVGEPVHYVLSALEKQYGGDESQILAEVARNPKNRFAYAVGNGAAPPDIDKFMKWFALEDMFELYGSTEAAISTFRRKGDPRGSVGEITDPAVKILNERGEECPPAELGADGKILNYHAGGRRDLPRRRRHEPLPGLLRQPRGEHQQVSRRRLPLRRSRPRARARRQALPLFRRPHRRLDPQGRRELLGRCRSRDSSRSIPTSCSPPPTASRARSPTSS